ncbi:MAG TPA: hypothetical protein ENI29_12715 [bacterium]|nr:hypothetical protein [archaeon]HEC39094.1 hypothetical protein [bacterium]
MTEVKKLQSNHIGTLQESSLHAALKIWYKKPGDKLEEPFENYLIDIVRDDLLIEIQTKNFSAIKKKITNLIQHNKMCLVHPISQDKWIINIDIQSNKILRRRLSPLHRSYIDIFEELIRIPDLISNPNLTIEIFLVQTEEIRKNDGKGSWRRRGWSICDKKLIGVLGKKEFNNPYDFLDFIPKSLDVPFTNFELAQSLNKPLRLARKMSYCLRKMGLIKVIGKKGNALIFDYL